MKLAVIRSCVRLFATALTIGPAIAQSTQPVEWKVSEGGNGHWYQVFSEVGDWNQYRDRCIAKGGHLATIANAAENTKVRLLLASGRFYLGGYQPNPTPSSEPLGGWAWITGEPWNFSPWSGSEPNNLGGIQHWLVMYEDGTWDDGGISASNVQNYACEWDADCNGDGLVDYGQILRGDVADLNGNGVPDICELSVTSVVPVSGPTAGGTPLTINGNNFPANPVVTLGGVAATDVVRHSATRITAMTPTNLPGTVDVTVNSWTSPDAFYYRPFCGSDLDNSGSVDAGDIAIILLDFGPCYPTETPVAADSALPFLLQDDAAPNSRAR